MKIVPLEITNIMAKHTCKVEVTLALVPNHSVQCFEVRFEVFMAVKIQFRVF